MPAPQQTIARLHAQAGLERHVREFALAVVFVEHAGVVGEMGFENAERSVQAVIAYADAHTGLLGAIFAQRDAALQAFFDESSVVPIAEVEAGRGIACDVDIGPAVVIEIGGDCGKSVGSRNDRRQPACSRR